MKKLMGWIEISAIVIGLQQHLRKGFGIACRDTRLIRDKLVYHLQLAPDQPVERIEPQHRRQRLCKKDIIGMSAADMRQLMVEDLSVDGFPDIHAFLPEEIVQEGEGRPLILYFDQHTSFELLY